MNIALLSDIHANHLALQAVLSDMQKRKQKQSIDGIWFLGDLVGYGPEPVSVVQWAQEALNLDRSVMGNHEELLAERLTGYQPRWRGRNNDVADTAIQAIEIHLREIQSQPQIEGFLRNIFSSNGHFGPKKFVIDNVSYILAHSSLADPMRYVYPWDDLHLAEEFQSMQAGLQESSRCILITGHTHIPLLAKKNLDAEAQSLEVKPDVCYKLDTDLTVINPGSVGQPRDADPRASYAILDTGALNVVFRRVPYDHEEAVRLLAARGYPFELQRRLAKAELPSRTPQFWRSRFGASEVSANS